MFILLLAKVVAYCHPTHSLFLSTFLWNATPTGYPRLGLAH